MFELDVILPVHNEGESIEATIREIHEEISPRVLMRFIISEDGSRDNTRDVLRRLSASLPMMLIFGEERKGYSRAVIDAMKNVQAPYCLALDSDGQCDPRDFWQFWDRREENDVWIGWRVDRADSRLRKAMSGAFKTVHSVLFDTKLRDPSCPFLLVKRRTLEQLMPKLGVLDQGFWWEFAARVNGAGFSMAELPVRHRTRAAGVTRVYSPRKIPGIAVRHLRGLLAIHSETTRGR